MRNDFHNKNSSRFGIETPLPVRRQPRKQLQIDRPPLLHLIPSPHPLAREPQPRQQRRAGMVLHVHIGPDPVDAQPVEGMADGRGDGLAGQALAPVRRQQPVADLGPAVFRVDVVETAGADETLRGPGQADAPPLPGAFLLDAAVPVELLTGGVQAGIAHAVVLDDARIAQALEDAGQVALAKRAQQAAGGVDLGAGECCQGHGGNSVAEALAVGLGRNAQVPQEQVPQRLLRAQPDARGHGLERQGGVGFEQPARGLQAGRFNEGRGAASRLLREHAAEVALAHRGAPGQHLQGERLGQVLQRPGLHVLHAAVGGRLAGELHAELRLSAGPLEVHDHVARHLQREGMAVVLFHQGKGEVDARGDTGGGPEVAVTHIDRIGIDRHTRMQFLQPGGHAPVGRGPAPVEQARSSQEEAAGAQGHHAAHARCRGARPRHDFRGFGQGRLDVAGADQQGRVRHRPARRIAAGAQHLGGVQGHQRVGAHGAPRAGGDGHGIAGRPAAPREVHVRIVEHRERPHGLERLEARIDDDVDGQGLGGVHAVGWETVIGQSGPVTGHRRARAGQACPACSIKRDCFFRSRGPAVRGMRGLSAIDMPLPGAGRPPLLPF